MRRKATKNTNKTTENTVVAISSSIMVKPLEILCFCFILKPVVKRCAAKAAAYLAPADIDTVNRPFGGVLAGRSNKVGNVYVVARSIDVLDTAAGIVFVAAADIEAFIIV